LKSNLHQICTKHQNPSIEKKGEVMIIIEGVLVYFSKNEMETI